MFFIKKTSTDDDDYVCVCLLNALKTRQNIEAKANRKQQSHKQWPNVLFKYSTFRSAKRTSKPLSCNKMKLICGQKPINIKLLSGPVFFNQLISVKPRRRWATPTCICCDGCPSTDLCHPQCAARRHRLTCPLLDVVLPWYTRSYICDDYHPLFLGQRIMTTDMAEPW